MSVELASAMLINAAQVAFLLLTFCGWALYCRAADLSVELSQQPEREAAFLRAHGGKA